MASESQRAWNRYRGKPNSTDATATCEDCDCSGTRHMVRMSYRLIPLNLHAQYRRLCSACRGHGGWSVVKVERVEAVIDQAKTYQHGKGGDR